MKKIGYSTSPKSCLALGLISSRTASACSKGTPCSLGPSAPESNSFGTSLILVSPAPTSGFNALDSAASLRTDKMCGVTKASEPQHVSKPFFSVSLGHLYSQRAQAILRGLRNTSKSSTWAKAFTMGCDRLQRSSLIASTSFLKLISGNNKH